MTLNEEPAKRCRAAEIRLLRGDITKQTVDVIVNAANSSLMGGGGVDGAIHRAGGPAILEECRRIRKVHGPCATGDAVITGAGKLKASYVVHTVGPVYKNGISGEPELLSSAYRKSLELAAQANASTVAFPSISTGVYGYPVEQAAPLALSAVAEFCANRTSIREIRFVLFDDRTFETYRRALETLPEN